jgi:hypothetical protein
VSPWGSAQCRLGGKALRARRSALGSLLDDLHQPGDRDLLADRLRTYAEILYDWFERLEQNAIVWVDADAVDLVAYRNRMMLEPSRHTGRPYRISTINHRGDFVCTET